jgi:drug/metabolite transporter (DMT)-like permease
MDNDINHKRAVSDTDIGMLLLLLGALFSGLRPLFGRWLITDDVPAIIIALYTYIASAALFLPIGFRAIRQRGRSRRTAILAFGTGLLVGVGGLAYFEALRRLPVATVTVIYFTYPAMVIAVVAVIRRRWPQRVAWFAAVCVLLGSGYIVGPALQQADTSAIDLAIAFITPLTWTLLLVLLAGPLTVLPARSRIGFISGGGAVAMIGLVLLWQPSTLLPHTVRGWGGLLGLVVVSGVLTHILLTIGVPKAGPERASIVGVFEAATALAVGWVLFQEPITANQGVGVLLIGIALFLTRRLTVDISYKI